MGQHSLNRHTLGRAILAFTLGTGIIGGLAACGSAPPAKAPQSAKYPYVPGVDYSWTDAPNKNDPYPQGRGYPWRGVTLKALSEQTDTFLSDMLWSSAKSGYGPIELDRSNNTNKGGDGLPLTIGGQTFAKGLGLHAVSDVRYALGGACTTFTAQVGVDDEVGNLGTVVFRVFGDGRELSPAILRRGSDGPQALSVDVTGVQELRLAVENGGDNIDYDHADWADAKVRCMASEPSGDKFLSDSTVVPLSATNGYGPFERDRSNGEAAGGDGNPIMIQGFNYPRGLGVHAASQLVYGLNGNCSTFTASVGVDDEVGDLGSVIFRVFVDGALMYDSGVMRGTDPAKAVNVSVASKNELKLVVADAGDGIHYDHANWANAKITCSVITPSVSSVEVNPVSAVVTVGGTRQFTADVKGTGAYDPKVVWTTSNPAVATVSSTGLLTAVSAGKVTVTATSVADPTKSGSAQVTVYSESTLPPGGVLINFQPASSTVPAGYTPDTGLAYDAKRGFGWIRQDSVGTGSSVPLDISPNMRDRALSGMDARLNTLTHMQFPANVSNSTAVRTPAAWEYALPSGVYTVTVSVGDPGNNYDSSHLINIENRQAIAPFTPVPTRKFMSATLQVSVTDGLLTVDARGGSNTKPNYVMIRPGDRPSIRGVSPQDAETMVATTVSVTVDVNLPNSGIDLATLNSQTVRLINAGTGMPVAASLNTSGGGDAIVLKPSSALLANTKYIFEVTSGLKDTSGAAFLPHVQSFVTGASLTGDSSAAFDQVALANAPAKPYTSLEIGPDNKLYAATLTGEILRFNMLPDGTLDVPQTITSVQAANGGPRTIIGMKFAPTSTADNLELWISNNYFWAGVGTAPDWSGKITRLTGPNLERVQDILIDLPRSIRDHMTNGISFRPGEPNVLYVLQGSNTAMGAPDTAWGNRPERLLTAALLRVDLTKITNAPLSVKTADGGLYNPYAPGAPVTIYASGIRNAYDLVWHTNGQLYVPTNGSAAGGNTPGTPSTLPDACQNRPDGPYTGPTVPGLTNVNVQRDFLFRIQPGGYFGHPNPLRCEWVMNGGNPTSGIDRGEVTDYPAGVLPDRNWRGFAFDFGEHVSANGVIEEYTSAQTSALKNKLMVVRYSAGKDIIVLTPGTNMDIVASETHIPGLSDFNPSPLDLTENRTNGHLYVAQLDEATGGGKITLARPR